jgi:hypothetical protein
MPHIAISRIALCREISDVKSMSDSFEWRTGRHCVFKNNIHLVFVTKYRRGVLTDSMLTRMEELMKETCKQMDCELIEFNGEHDHVLCELVHYVK